MILGEGVAYRVSKGQEELFTADPNEAICYICDGETKVSQILEGSNAMREIELDWKSKHAKAYIKRSTISIRADPEDPVRFFEYSRLDGKIPIMMLRREGVETMLKIFNRAETEMKKEDMTCPGESRDIVFKALVRREQPNKETVNEVFIDVLSKPSEGIIEVPYEHWYQNIHTEAVDEICTRMLRRPERSLYKDKDIEAVFVIPNMLIRSDVFLYLVMTERSLKDHFYISEKNSYSTEAKFRIQIKLEYQDRPYTSRVKNIAMTSLTQCRKLGIKYRTGCVSITVRGIQGRCEMLDVWRSIDTLMEVYKNRYKEASKMFDDVIERDKGLYEVKMSKETRLKSIRGEMPDLFVQRYTRESPIMPHIVKEEEVDSLRSKGVSVLRYPRSGPMSRYYAAPEGYHVGLKYNRLHNSSMFTYIVTCYQTDHSLKQGSNTYRYLAGAEEKEKTKREDYMSRVKRLEPWQRGTIPEHVSRLLNHEERRKLVRIGVPRDPKRFVREMLGKAQEEIRPQLAKQELWYMTLDEIASLWKSPDTYENLFKMRRIIEELAKADIVIIKEHLGKTRIEIPETKKPYIWRKRFRKSIIITHTVINEYEDVYEFIATEEGRLYLVSGDPLYNYTDNKIYAGPSQEGVMDVGDVEAVEEEIRMQYIDGYGKTVLVEDLRGESKNVRIAEGTPKRGRAHNKKSESVSFHRRGGEICNSYWRRSNKNMENIKLRPTAYIQSPQIAKPQNTLVSVFQ
eukprot:TRINITY_DN1176_c0_g1_i3.p2 TRINITY_DN1176_c0_g1~~TRINITY_DN1176_c0_g1_i3.p2  ORF type:complete len:739 (+),score=37.04 TRINITY_DN1176_c0_g1_i3:4837-7053(+)